MGSNYSAWKTFERRFAALMRGIRLWRPDYGDSAPDGQSETHTWDCKAYAKHRAITMYLECEQKYRAFTGNRRFVLALFAREHPRAGDFVLLRARDYAADQAELEGLRKMPR